MSDIDQGLPRGFRDILPTEARELHLIRDGLMRTFGSYGYVPIEPPSVEHARAATSVDERRMIRFLDQGNLLTLRPDVTTAIARVVSQRYAEARGALRLSYFTTVFRQERSMRGSEREYDQAGIELVGAAGAVADAEVLAVLCEALSAVGLRSFTIEVGHIGAVRALFEGLSSEAIETVLGHLRKADHVGAFATAAAAGLSAAQVAEARRALAVRGRGIETLTGAAVMELRDTVHLAREAFPFAPVEPRDEGRALWGVPDLSVIPALPYYTGVVFEVVSPHVGSPIAMGGRYDGLLGMDRPATGFGIAIPHLHQALVADGWSPPADDPVVSLEAPFRQSSSEEGDGARILLRAAAALRREGLSVALGPLAETAGRAAVTVRAVDEVTFEYEGRRLSARDLGTLLKTYQSIATERVGS